MAILKDFVLATFCLQIEIKTINIKTIAILFSRQGRILHNGKPGAQILASGSIKRQAQVCIYIYL